MSIRETIRKRIPFMVPLFDGIKWLCSIFVLPELLKLEKNKEHIIFVPNGLGEITIILSYIQSYMGNKGLKKVRIMMDERRKECKELFENKNISISLVNSKRYSLYAVLFLSAFGQKMLKQLDYIVFFDSQKRQKRLGENAFSDMKKIMGLSDNDKFINPMAELQTKKDIKDPYVLLNPYARTIQEIDMGVFEYLVKKYNGIGIKCYTVVCNKKQKEVKGSEKILCDLKEAIELTKKCKRIIGIRSGFLDLVSLTNAPMTCFYPSSEKKDMYFSFSKCEWAENVTELVIGKNVQLNRIWEEILRASKDTYMDIGSCMDWH